MSSNENIRPQPSGETREIAQIIREEYERLVISGDDKRDNADRASDRILALLSARLASGGQHSGGEWRCEDCGAQADEWFDCCKNPARAEAQDEGAETELIERLVEMHKLAHAVWQADRDPGMGRTLALVELGKKAERLSETLVQAMIYASYSRPVTKPAQDEGAAGPSCQRRHNGSDTIYNMAEEMRGLIMARNIPLGPNVWPEHIQKPICAALDQIVSIILNRAHPSPPPAADEDRVRSALTDLVTWFDKPVQGERGMVWVIRAGDQGADDAVAEALAALKSEGK